MRQRLKERFGKSAIDIEISYDKGNSLQAISKVIQKIQEVQKQNPNMVLFHDVQTWIYENQKFLVVIMDDKTEHSEEENVNRSDN